MKNITHHVDLGKLAIWANNNKARLEGQWVGAIIALAQSELNHLYPPTAIRTACVSAGISLKRNVKKEDVNGKLGRLSRIEESVSLLSDEVKTLKAQVASILS